MANLNWLKTVLAEQVLDKKVAGRTIRQVTRNC